MRRKLFLSLALPVFLTVQAQEAPKPLPRPVPEKPASQPYGSLRVHVKSAKGTPLAGALVAIEKLQRSHETGETGDVLLGWVPVGKHDVKVTLAAYKGATATAKIEEDGITVLTVQLEAESN